MCVPYIRFYIFNSDPLGTKVLATQAMTNDELSLCQPPLHQHEGKARCTGKLLQLFAMLCARQRLAVYEYSGSDAREPQETGLLRAAIAAVLLSKSRNLCRAAIAVPS